MGGELQSPEIQCKSAISVLLSLSCELVFSHSFLMHLILYVPLLTKTSFVNIGLFICVNYQYKWLTLMSYLSSCCISLHTRYVRLYSSSLYLKTLWVISFGHTIQRWCGFHVTLFGGLCPSSRIVGIPIAGCTSDPLLLQPLPS